MAGKKETNSMKTHFAKRTQTFRISHPVYPVYPVKKAILQNEPKWMRDYEKQNEPKIYGLFCETNPNVKWALQEVKVLSMHDRINDIAARHFEPLAGEKSVYFSRRPRRLQILTSDSRLLASSKNCETNPNPRFFILKTRVA
jgi:hypothetical protein